MKAAQGKHPDGERNATAGRPAPRLFDLTSLRHDSHFVARHTIFHGHIAELSCRNASRRSIAIGAAADITA
jgi:hypothetical protein